MSINVNPDEDFHVVINGNVITLSLDALCAAYEGDVIHEQSAIWQPGLGEWMRLDTILYHLEQQEVPQQTQAPAAEIDDERYYVQIADDEVKQMTLDQLDTAYRLDLISDGTLIWQPGYTEWVPLALLIGSEPEQNHYSLAPSLAPQPPAQSQAYYAQAPAPSRAPAQQSLAPAPDPFAYAGQSPSLAPVSTRAPVSTQYHSLPSAAPNSLAAVANSYIPDIPPPPAKASPWYARTLVAAAALVALGVAHQNGVGYQLTANANGFTAEGAWEDLVGAPSPNTPFGLKQWLSGLEKKYSLTELSATESSALSTSTVNSGTLGSGKINLNLPEISPTAANHSGAANSPAPSADRAAPSSAAAEKPTNTPAAATAFGHALADRAAPQKTRSQAPVHQYKPAKTKAAKTTKNKGGQEYDPMNGAL